MLRLLCLLGLLAGPRLPAQVLAYTFGTAASPSVVATTVAPQLSASSFSGWAGTPATASGSPVHAAGSGGSFFTATAWTGPAPGSNRFEFTVAPVEGYLLDPTSLRFAYRATATGPASFAVRSSADAFAGDLWSGRLVNDATGRTVGPFGLTLEPTAGPLVFRLYASGATSALGTLRVDDVILDGTLTVAPEPGIAGVVLGMAGLVAAGAWRRRRDGGEGNPGGSAPNPTARPDDHLPPGLNSMETGEGGAAGAAEAASISARSPKARCAQSPIGSIRPTSSSSAFASSARPASWARIAR